MPKRALAAPSSMQRSKFTLAPGWGCVLVFVYYRTKVGRNEIKCGERGKKGRRRLRTCEVGVLQSRLTALGFEGFWSAHPFPSSRVIQGMTHIPLITLRGAKIVDHDHD